MGILIHKAGVLDTFQDLGRNGFRKFGINPNGAMDKNSLRLINLLLENAENEAALEMHFPAPAIVFEKPTVFTLGGANFKAKLNKLPVDIWKTLSAEKGSVLKFHKNANGSRCYLGVKGGFEIENWLGSASTNLTAQVGGFDGRRLRKGDRISFRSQIKLISNNHFQAAVDCRVKHSKSVVLRITAGREYRNLTALSEQVFLKKPYKITRESNRMGFRLAGDPLHLLSDQELLSSAVNFGTIQLLLSGQLVVLMADHQTTGGYPRIAHIIESDLSKIAQCGAGDEIRFEVVSLKEAERIGEKFERDLSFLRMGVKFRSDT